MLIYSFAAKAREKASAKICFEDRLIIIIDYFTMNVHLILKFIYKSSAERRIKFK